MIEPDKNIRNEDKNQQATDIILEILDVSNSKTEFWTVKIFLEWIREHGFS